MKNFVFKSRDQDLQKMFQLIETQQKNILYITYRVDKILKEITTLRIDKSLQTTVDTYFDDDSPPNEDKEPD